MELEKMIKALGLPEQSTEADVLAAIAALAAESGKPKAEPIAATATLEHVVPRADYDAVQAKLAAVEAAQAKKAREDFERTVDTAIDEAVKAGRVTPAAKDYHRGSILARAAVSLDDGGKALAEFAKYVGTQPELVGNAQGQAAQTRDAAGASARATSAEIRTLCAQLGITPEQFAVAQQDTRDNPDTYNPDAYRHAI